MSGLHRSYGLVPDVILLGETVSYPFSLTSSRRTPLPERKLFRAAIMRSRNLVHIVRFNNCWIYP